MFVIELKISYDKREFVHTYTKIALTHCGQVTPDGDRYLGQPWLR